MLATALAAGCAHQASTAIDPTLPESDAARDRGTAVEILTRAADDAEPGPRGRALGLLIRASREPGGGEWGARALWDPDAWVQREAVHALAERLPEPASRDLLIDYVGRDTAEPYVRGSAALALARSGSTDTRDALAAAWRAEPAPWRAAPLQLAAAVLGDAEAIEPLARTIASGELPLEVDFVLDVGTSGCPTPRRPLGWATPRARARCGRRSATPLSCAAWRPSTTSCASTTRWR